MQPQLTSRQHAGSRKLIVRIGGVGCLIQLTEVVEVCKQVADQIDWLQVDPLTGVVGSFEFRQDRMPVIDPAQRLGLKLELDHSELVVLILSGAEGNRAVLVDRVDGVCPVSDFVECEIPLLLKFSLSGYYSKIFLYRGEPMIVLEQEHFSGVSTEVA